MGDEKWLCRWCLFVLRCEMSARVRCALPLHESLQEDWPYSFSLQRRGILFCATGWRKFGVIPVGYFGWLFTLYAVRGNRDAGPSTED